MKRTGRSVVSVLFVSRLASRVTICVASFVATPARAQLEECTNGPDLALCVGRVLEQLPALLQLRFIESQVRVADLDFSSGMATFGLDCDPLFAVGGGFTLSNAGGLLFVVNSHRSDNPTQWRFAISKIGEPPSSTTLFFQAFCSAFQPVGASAAPG